MSCIPAKWNVLKCIAVPSFMCVSFWLVHVHCAFMWYVHKCIVYNDNNCCCHCKQCTCVLFTMTIVVVIVNNALVYIPHKSTILFYVMYVYINEHCWNIAVSVVRLLSLYQMW